MYWGNLYRGTPAELAIEPAIAALGLTYRFQHPMFLWGVKAFPDFVLPTIGVVLEVDDPSHDEPEKRQKDAQRTSLLETLGWVVVRCSNDEALTNPQETVARLLTPHLQRQGPGLPSAPSKSRKPKRKSRTRKAPNPRL